MIIIVGPDASGKTTLTKYICEKYNLQYYHFTKEHLYLDYIKLLSNLNLLNSVTDRHFLCEYPYSKFLNRKFKYSKKEWHNMLLMTLIQNPLFILCTYKPDIDKYDKNQYLPYKYLENCLQFYRKFFDSHFIPYIEYNYAENNINFIELEIEKNLGNCIDWWIEMWNKGFGCVGSLNPEILLVAERIGPNNNHYIPFESGPTGYRLSDMFSSTKTPLGEIAITNMIKIPKNTIRDSLEYNRKVSEEDKILLENEINILNPKKIVFMGKIAEGTGGEIVKKFNCKTFSIKHLGYYNHRGITDLKEYYRNWRRILEE